jgi:hypothetical protein
MPRHPDAPPDFEPILQAARRRRAEFATSLILRAWAMLPVSLLSLFFPPPPDPAAPSVRTTCGAQSSLSRPS